MLHRTGLSQVAQESFDIDFSFADEHVHYDSVGALLVCCQLTQESRFAGLTVSQDCDTLAKDDGKEAVYRSDTTGKLFIKHFAVHNARCKIKDTRVLCGGNRP